MINGEVRPAHDDGTGLEARIMVHVVGASRVFRTLEVVVDTGYTGWMSLPEPIINDIGLDYMGIRPATLANGQTVPTAAYNAGLLWHGRPVDVVVQALNNKPMVGAELLAYCRLTVDWWDGGEVVIEERMPAA